MPPPPNVLWICMDQHPLANREHVARHLPLQIHMARAGTRFDQAYTVLPICSPARASMLTGTYPHTHGVTENDGRFGGRAGLDPTDWMVHQPFKEAGYDTAWFGKWHLDNDRDAGCYGFDGMSLPGYGYPYATPAYADYLKGRNLPAPMATVEQPGEGGTFAAGARLNLQELEQWPEYEAGTLLIDGPAELHEVYFVADLAKEWLRLRASDDPFFLRVDTWGPHPPYCVAAPFTHLYADEDLRPANFNSDLSHRPAHHARYRDTWDPLGLDDAGWQRLARRSMQQTSLVETAMLGLLETLEQLGLSDNTLIVVTADHGDAVASNGGCANKGGLLVEETIRVPLAVAGPVIPAGQTRQETVTNMDIPATLLAQSNLPLPEHIQGRPLPFHGSSAAGQGRLIQHYGLHDPIVLRAWVRGGLKLVAQEDGFLELYDLGDDPCELRNLAPLEAHGVQLKKMVAGMRSEMARLGDEGPAQRALLAAL